MGNDLLGTLFRCSLWLRIKIMSLTSSAERACDLLWSVTSNINCFQRAARALIRKWACLCLVCSRVKEEQVLGVNDSLREYFDLSY